MDSNYSFPNYPFNLDSVIKMREARSNLICELEKERDSRIFVLWNMDDLKEEDFFTLADMLEDESPNSDIELVLLSPGGNGGAGYRIGHTFQQWTKKRNHSFRVIIPLYAMSAATIISLGAEKLIMGLQSEIGPIDPQFPIYDQNQGRRRYIPALTVIDGLKLISEYIKKIPEMGKFFEQVIRNEQLTLVHIGMLERARESTKQWGETLLKGGMLPDEHKARKAVERLSDFYKDHGHPIDAFEAEDQLGLKVEYLEGEPWQKIKRLRDLYNNFVGIPGLIPGVVVSCAIETNARRHWRYVALEQDEHSRVLVYAPTAPEMDKSTSLFGQQI